MAGRQALFGITPDLTTLGKIVGGGLPVGAYGGRAEIMDHVLPAGKVFQAGTLSGNPAGHGGRHRHAATCCATIHPTRQLEALGARLEEGLHRAAPTPASPHQIARVGSMMTLFFNPAVVTDWDVASRSDTARYARYFWGLIDRGVYMPCSQYEALFVSAAHRESDIDATVAAAAEVFTERELRA